MERKLCPKCGAYWQCDCRFDEPPPLPKRNPAKQAAPLQLSPCPHDWVEAVGVEVDSSIGIEAGQVLVCRLCGLYAVEEQVGGSRYADGDP